MAIHIEDLVFILRIETLHFLPQTTVAYLLRWKLLFLQLNYSFYQNSYDKGLKWVCQVPILLLDFENYSPKNRKNNFSWSNLNIDNTNVHTFFLSKLLKSSLGNNFLVFFSSDLENSKSFYNISFFMTMCTIFVCCLIFWSNYLNVQNSFDYRL